MVVVQTQFELRQFSFRYPDEPHLTLAGINLAIREGEFVVICGPSGSGKTTLLRHLKRELKPAGTAGGEILYYGRPLNEYPLSELSPQIGMVMQDPDSQIVMDDVNQELVFGMENLGFKTDCMRRRAAEITAFFGIGPWLHRKTSELSGGQKQILNLASVLLLEPRVLLLDEPLAQLDPVTSREFVQMLHTLNRETGMTVIVSEHRLDELLPVCDRVVMMDRGEISHTGPPRDIAVRLYRDENPRLKHYVPSIARLALAVQSSKQETPAAVSDANVPLTVREGRKWAATVEWRKPAGKLVLDQDPEILLSCEGLYFQYARGGPMVLKHCSIELEKGDFLALLGGNGSGKSTLLKIIAGMLKPQRGAVRWRDKKWKALTPDERRGRIGYTPQDPMVFFVHDTVEKELYHSAVRRSARSVDARIESVAARFGLKGLLKRHPYDLSGGERQKAMLACVLLSEPEVLLLDEPTSGMDPAAKAELGELLAEWNRKGTTVLMVTHDLEFAANVSRRCALMFDGAVASEGEKHAFFSQNFYYTTPVNRVLRTWLPKAIVPEDAVR